ncbi:hypothetical protein [Aeromonas sp. MR7]|uniref:hypothetical protein n=1 Tax=Aeromonas sp. MR7 TaxID=2923419 RepID=UPI001F4AD0BD|nr:hypothetical protein [Aeromonas sp. MR7]MCH7350148.1 hypothetical protein [Aeromonas sp. MR7]
MASIYRDAYDEAQRIIRVSEEVRITLERIANDSDEREATTTVCCEQANEVIPKGTYFGVAPDIPSATAL